jgi:hypothetical protein
MITIEQVTGVEAQAAEAEQQRGAAERALTAAPYSELAALNLTEASKKAAQLSASARELRQAYEEQVAEERAAADHESLEKAAAPLIEAARKELEAARKRLVARVDAAQKVIVELMDEAAAYNQVVAAHADALDAAGLGLKAGWQTQTGGHQRVTGPVVRIKGREYEQADPGLVVVWTTHRVGAARLPDMHPVAGALGFFAGCQAIEAQAATLFAGLATPKKVQYEPIRWLNAGSAA